MIKVSIKRTPVETIIIAKSDVPGEKAFKFESLSTSITKERIRLILPMMIESEREKRVRKAHRKQQLKEIKEEKADRLARGEEVYGKEIE